MTRTPAPLQDLAPIFAAMERGTPKNRVRVLKAACPRGHTLADVYRGESGALWALFRAMNKGGGRSTGDKQIVAVRLGEPERRGKPVFMGNPDVWCRDGRWKFPVALLLDALEGKEKTVVIPSRYNLEALLAQAENEESALDAYMGRGQLSLPQVILSRGR